MNSAELTYRRAAAQEATAAGLVVILYDLLVEDLGCAIQAMQRGAIEDRSKHLKHALLVLQILETSLDMGKGGVAAQKLAAFYSHLRRQVLDSQYKNDDAILVRQVELILGVREAWCTADASQL